MSEDRVFLGLGSNIGNSKDNLNQAIEELKNSGKVILISESSVIETEAWGIENQPNFFNQVIEITTSLNPFDLLVLAKDIEEKIGRVKSYRWGPRLIDIDIIVYGEKTVSTKELIIPHKHCLDRDFVMGPLKEIAPDIYQNLISGKINQEDNYFQDERRSILNNSQLSKLMGQAIAVAKEGMSKNEIPIGSIIVIINDKEPEIVGVGYNTNIENLDRISHAEMNAFKDAAKNLKCEFSLINKKPKLDEQYSILISTLEPCIMCFSAALLSGVNEIVFGCVSHSDSGSTRVEMIEKEGSSWPVLTPYVNKQEVKDLFIEWQKDHSENDRHWDFVNRVILEN